MAEAESASTRCGRWEWLLALFIRVNRFHFLPARQKMGAKKKGADIMVDFRVKQQQKPTVLVLFKKQWF